ncbi:MAG TPA: hypothetical protein VJG30_00150 [Candidatus Nanoarchaeia archaeon]|nr:hypothetical protein [Candidatus Nanoarchaeia archaeon]
MTDNEFRPSEDLEKLVNNAETNVEFLSQGQKDSSLNNTRLRSVLFSKFGEDPRYWDMPPAGLLRRLEENRNNAFTALQGSIDDEAYANAVKFYTKDLEGQVKGSMYLGLIKEGRKVGLKFEEPSKGLVDVLKRYQAIATAEELLKEGKDEQAAQVLNEYLSESQKVDILLDSLSAAPAYIANRKKVVSDTIKIQNAIAAIEIDEKNLYKEIDDAMANVEYSKALNLMFASGAYNMQQNINEKRKQQEEQRAQAQRAA